METDWNLNPHAEAVIARALYPREYAEQNGGIMDFWEVLNPRRRIEVRQLLDRLGELPREHDHPTGDD